MVPPASSGPGCSADPSPGGAAAARRSAGVATSRITIGDTADRGGAGKPGGGQGAPHHSDSGKARAAQARDRTAWRGRDGHGRPGAGRRAAGSGAGPAGSSATPASPYQTGAPNMGGGTAVVPQLASQMTVSGADINARPITRPGEIVEAAPGLMVIEHADGGKANQYYLRGWNLDHGTDLAIFVDDVPINLPTNVHGQGYADLNWLIPETISGVDIRKGPFFADVGDFANAGNLHISLAGQRRKEHRVDHDRQLRLPTHIWRSARPRSATARCSMPANSTPITVRGPVPTTCASSAALCATARAPRRMASRSPARPTPTIGTPPTKSRCAPSRRGRSLSMANLIPPTAATPAAFRSPAE